MTGDVFSIREARPDDYAAIFDLTQRAFAPTPYASGTEGHIVLALRDDGDLTISLVAVAADQIIGHVAFSPATVGETNGAWYALGPVSVAPEQQKTGIGNRLITAGLDHLRGLAASGCVLIGSPSYYGRFGFTRYDGLTYGTVPAEYVQGLAFTSMSPVGEITFAPGFDVQPK